MSIEVPSAIFCADIGSIAVGKFDWAGILRGSEPQELVSGSEIAQLAETVADKLNSGVPVALGFECPLSVPISKDPARLTSARNGEGRRAWSASGGSGALSNRADGDGLAPAARARVSLIVGRDPHEGAYRMALVRTVYDVREGVS